jgi:hypothetical protein
LSGTGGTFFDYPARLALNEPRKYRLDAGGSHEWLDEKDLARMRKMFTHPLWRKLAERAKGGGHGGMDFVMNWRHLDCIRQGITPDSVVYDAASWSSILELSSLSVAAGSMPVNIPDFTRGLWKTMEPLPVAFKEPGRSIAVPEKIAEWTPKDLQADWVVKTWDVGKGITGPGEYSFEFQYTRGTHRLDFRKLALLANDAVLAKDDTPGRTGTENVHNLYRFHLTKHDPSAKYLLQAEIKADGGIDSYGDILICRE